MIAGVLFYADWRLQWEGTKDATLWAVLVYFILNGVLTFWIWGVEKGKVFSGERDNTLVRYYIQASKEIHADTKL